jgi:hypothetical protein
MGTMALQTERVSAQVRDLAPVALWEHELVAEPAEGILRVERAGVVETRQRCHGRWISAAGSST